MARETKQFENGIRRPVKLANRVVRPIGTDSRCVLDISVYERITCLDGVKLTVETVNLLVCR